MVTLLNCIERVPEKIRLLLDTRKENIDPLFTYLGSHIHTIDEIAYIGSGTSYNTAVSVKGFVEKVTRIRVGLYTPNEFLNNRYVRSRNTLYIFLSQSGTSVTTRKAQMFMKEQGYLTVAITQNPDEYMSQECGVHINMMCADEEYKMRTIGYVNGILINMLVALEIALKKGSITEKEYTDYIADAYTTSVSHKSIKDKTFQWFEKNKTQLCKSQMFAVYGIDSLWGVALEGALKLIEIGKIMSLGYEMEEGMHGPTLGFHSGLCVLVLNEGKRENDRANGLVRFVKGEFGNGFMIGNNPIDSCDLDFEPASKYFYAIEFATVLQVLSWCLAQEKNVDLTAPIAENEKPYFQTHKYTAKI